MNQLDQDEKLIIEVQQYPGLYDQSSYDYRDLRKKESMWQSVADSLGLHARECQARWRVLRDKFVREMRKNVNPKRAGSSALQVYQGSWPLMSQLMFLTSHVKHRPYRAGRRDTYSDAGGTEDEEDGEPSDEEDIEVKHNPTTTTTTTTTNNNNNNLHTTNNIHATTPSRCPTPPNPKRMRTQSFEADFLKLTQTEQELQKVLTTRQGPRVDDEENGERLFCLSLVPVLRRLEPGKRSLAKLQIQRVLHNLEFPQVKVEL
ncbi:transcription factor Adf-1-like [Homarus americanus]|uniref:Transcription factor Adf-1-like 6 n=1 Tax=Homarus americanus TaxID=6706 RepID=A0A8J5MKH5_HOMAM|nr:transcription factor Adf-1-like [Homarus americanus]KAG7154759.1 Transcription factor Adf-1-like 6 [Homarus americanus]